MTKAANSQLNRTVADAISATRRARGLSVDDVAESIEGYDKHKLYRIEGSQQHIRMADLEAFAAFFEVPPSWLISGDPGSGTEATPEGDTDSPPTPQAPAVNPGSDDPVLDAFMRKLKAAIQQGDNVSALVILAEALRSHAIRDGL